MSDEDRSFEKFVAVMQLIGVGFGLMALYIWAFGIPNFSDIDAQREFCIENGGYPIEPSRDTYNEFLCGFRTETGFFRFHADQLDDEFAQYYVNKSGGDWCYTCWDSEACSSGYGQVLDEKTGCVWQ